MANANSGLRRATRSATAVSPLAWRSSHGSSPSGATAMNVCAANFWSSSNALSAALRPASSPSKVKITSPRNASSSMSSRRSTVMCSVPNAVPHEATAVGTPEACMAITSV